MAAAGVKVLSPDGELLDLAPESARNVLAENAGYLPATPENIAHAKLVKENGGIGNGIIANIEAGARGLTGGLSDLAEVKSGLTTPEALRTREEAFPKSAAVAKMVGGGVRVAGTAAAGTAAALALAPIGLGAAALGGIGLLGGMAAAGAGGAAAGASEELSREALGPGPLVGEQIAQQALWGGVIDAASVPLGKLGGIALGRLFKGAAGLAGFAERQAVRATGATGVQLGKLADKGLTEDVGRQILDKGYLGKGFTNLGNTATEARAMALADKGAAGSIIGETLANTTAEAPTTALAGDLRALAIPHKMELSPKPWRAALDKAAALLDEHGVGPNKDLPVSALQVVKTELDDIIGGMGKVIPRELATARRLVSQAMERALPEQEQAAYVAAKQQFGLAKEATKLLSRAANKEAGSAPSGILNQAKDPGLIVSTATGGPTGAAAYLGAKFASQVKSFGNVARAADYLSTTKVMQSLAKGATGQWDGAITSILQGASSGTVKAVVGMDKYDDVARGVEEAAQDPEQLTGAIHAALGPGMSEHHPEIATNAAMVMQQAFKYLNEKRPKPNFAPTPYDSAYKPPDYLKAQWLDMVRGVVDPASVAANPSRDSLAAMQAIYPETYNAIVAKMQDRLAAHGNVPYRTKMIATQFMGLPVSTLTDAALGQRMQALYAAHDPANKQQPEGQQGTARTQGARSMRIKQIAQDDTTAVGHIQEHASGA